MFVCMLCYTNQDLCQYIFLDGKVPIYADWMHFTLLSADVELICFKLCG